MSKAGKVFKPDIPIQNGDNLSFFILLLFTSALGLMSLFSASYYFCDVWYSNPFQFVIRQGMWLILSFLVCYILIITPMNFLRQLSFVLVVVAIVLNVLVLFPYFGIESGGAYRWLNIFNRYTFQPSELARLALIFYISDILARKDERIHDTVNVIVPPLLVLALLLGIVLMQNDFSTAFLIYLSVMVVLFVAKINLGVFIGINMVSLGVLASMIIFKPYRRERIFIWINRGVDPTGSGLQGLASRKALISGGLFGKGPGMSSFKLGRLPACHSDYILAVIGEEFGLFGVLVVIALFALIAVKGFSLAIRAKDRFTQYLAFGLTSSLLYQAIINIAVVGGIIPTTGIPLPFFSNGGSNLLVTMMSMGLLMNLNASHQKERAQ